MTTTELRNIAASGGGFIIDCSRKTATELRNIAAAGAAHGATVIMVNIGRKTPTELRNIAAVSPGNVIFDLR